MDFEARERARRLALRDQERRARRAGGALSAAYGDDVPGSGADGGASATSNANGYAVAEHQVLERKPPESVNQRILKERLKRDYEDFRAKYPKLPDEYLLEVWRHKTDADKFRSPVKKEAAVRGTTRTEGAGDEKTVTPEELRRPDYMAAAAGSRKNVAAKYSPDDDHFTKELPHLRPPAAEPPKGSPTDSQLYDNASWEEDDSHSRTLERRAREQDPLSGGMNTCLGPGELQEKLNATAKKEDEDFSSRMEVEQDERPPGGGLFLYSNVDEDNAVSRNTMLNKSGPGKRVSVQDPPDGVENDHDSSNPYVDKAAPPAVDRVKAINELQRRGPFVQNSALLSPARRDDGQRQNENVPGEAAGSLALPSDCPGEKERRKKRERQAAEWNAQRVKQKESGLAEVFHVAELGRATGASVDETAEEAAAESSSGVGYFGSAGEEHARRRRELAKDVADFNQKQRQGPQQSQDLRTTNVDPPKSVSSASMGGGLGGSVTRNDDEDLRNGPPAVVATASSVTLPATGTDGFGPAQPALALRSTTTQENDDPFEGRLLLRNDEESDAAERKRLALLAAHYNKKQMLDKQLALLEEKEGPRGNGDEVAVDGKDEPPRKNVIPTGRQLQRTLPGGSKMETPPNPAAGIPDEQLGLGMQFPSEKSAIDRIRQKDLEREVAAANARNAETLSRSPLKDKAFKNESTTSHSNSSSAGTAAGAGSILDQFSAAPAKRQPREHPSATVAPLHEAFREERAEAQGQLEQQQFLQNKEAEMRVRKREQEILAAEYNRQMAQQKEDQAAQEGMLGQTLLTGEELFRPRQELQRTAAGGPADAGDHGAAGRSSSVAVETRSEIAAAKKHAAEVAAAAYNKLIIEQKHLAIQNRLLDEEIAERSGSLNKEKDIMGTSYGYDEETRKKRIEEEEEKALAAARKEAEMLRREQQALKRAYLEGERDAEVDVTYLDAQKKRMAELDDLYDRAKAKGGSDVSAFAHERAYEKRNLYVPDEKPFRKPDLQSAMRESYAQRGRDLVDFYNAISPQPGAGGHPHRPQYPAAVAENQTGQSLVDDSHVVAAVNGQLHVQIQQPSQHYAHQPHQHELVTSPRGRRNSFTAATSANAPEPLGGIYGGTTRCLSKLHEDNAEEKRRKALLVECAEYNKVFATKSQKGGAAAHSAAGLLSSRNANGARRSSLDRLREPEHLLENNINASRSPNKRASGRVNATTIQATQEDELRANDAKKRHAAEYQADLARQIEEKKRRKEQEQALKQMEDEKEDERIRRAVAEEKASLDKLEDERKKKLIDVNAANYNKVTSGGAGGGGHLPHNAKEVSFFDGGGAPVLLSARGRRGSGGSGVGDSSSFHSVGGAAGGSGPRGEREPSFSRIRGRRGSSAGEDASFVDHPGNTNTSNTGTGGRKNIQHLESSFFSNSGASAVGEDDEKRRKRDKIAAQRRELEEQMAAQTRARQEAKRREEQAEAREEARIRREIELDRIKYEKEVSARPENQRAIDVAAQVQGEKEKEQHLHNPTSSRGAAPPPTHTSRSTARQEQMPQQHRTNSIDIEPKHFGRGGTPPGHYPLDSARSVRRNSGGAETEISRNQYPAADIGITAANMIPTRPVAAVVPPPPAEADHGAKSLNDQSEQTSHIINEMMVQQQSFVKHLESQVAELRNQRDEARKVVFALKDQKLDEKADELKTMKEMLLKGHHGSTAPGVGGSSCFGAAPHLDILGALPGAGSFGGGGRGTGIGGMGNSPSSNKFHYYNDTASAGGGSDLSQMLLGRQLAAPPFGGTAARGGLSSVNPLLMPHHGTPTPHEQPYLAGQLLSARSGRSGIYGGTGTRPGAGGQLQGFQQPQRGALDALLEQAQPRGGRGQQYGQRNMFEKSLAAESKLVDGDSLEMTFKNNESLGELISYGEQL